MVKKLKSITIKFRLGMTKSTNNFALQGHIDADGVKFLDETLLGPN